MLFKNIRFDTKLKIGMISILMLSIIVVSSLSIYKAKQRLYELGCISIDSSTTMMYNSLLLQVHTVLDTVIAANNIARATIKHYGKLRIDATESVPFIAVNNVLNQRTTTTIPAMYMGDTLVTSDEANLATTISKLTNTKVTIFQLIDEKLVRVSTSVFLKDGSSSKGTFIDNDSAIYTSIKNGQVFTGRALVADVWHMTVYTPLLDDTNTVIGAIFTGVPLIAEEAYKLITNTKLGKGYFFLYDKNGTLIIHPTLEGKNAFDVIPELRDHKNGFIRYVLKDKAKVTFAKYIEPWEYFIAMGLNEEDVVNNIDVDMIKYISVISIILIVLSIGVILLLIRLVTVPLKELSAKSLIVGEGDYTVTFESENFDDIGNLTRTMQVMTTNLNKMVTEVNEGIAALSEASTDLENVSENMRQGAEDTSNQANSVATAAEEMSSNMQGVSAASEQATSNITLWQLLLKR